MVNSPASGEMSIAMHTMRRTKVMVLLSLPCGIINETTTDKNTAPQAVIILPELVQHLAPDLISVPLSEIRHSRAYVENLPAIAELVHLRNGVPVYAEALAATGQIDAAVKELNKIHERAGLEAYRSSEFITPEECIGAILKERTIELVGEGKYWFDLLRTGHASDIGGVDSQDKWLFPISKTHLDENHLLKQNPGYGVE